MADVPSTAHTVDSVPHNFHGSHFYLPQSTVVDQVPPTQFPVTPSTVYTIPVTSSTVYAIPVTLSTVYAIPVTSSTVYTIPVSPSTVYAIPVDQVPPT